ncbi:MAG: DUF1015 domain-containing protein, partial [candidate division Zixibacteria bacterium]|nr:DUF1015 domain-containing protein [candidate division Zixibacteria bacterium]
IVPDEKPGIYVYRITFREEGRERENLGFFALGKLEEYLERGVAPHENILAMPREDRLKLRLSTQADFGPVYLLYRDRERVFEKIAAAVLSRPPVAQAYDMAGDWHRLWKLTYSSDIDKIVSLLASRPVLIADGHHRYDAALESCRRNPDKPWFAHRLMAFFNALGGGLSIRPIHRLLYDLKLSKKECLGRLSENFEVSILYAGGSDEDFLNAQKRVRGNAKKEHRFGLLLEDSFYLLACLRTENLDVAVLNEEILKNVLGFSEEELRKVLDYSKDAGEVAEKVGMGKAKAGFILNPTRMEEIWKVVQSGQKLPPKSTFFYPKLLTGLVMNINAEFYKGG